MAVEGFLRRWSRLKGGAEASPQSLQSRGKDRANVLRESGQAAEAGANALPASLAPDDAAGSRQDGAAVPSREALPTLEDAMRLTPQSDYSAFMARGVDKEARRIAMKKLFADPHFNQLDGLDIYMGDYNRADPLPAPMLAALRQAQDFIRQETSAEEGDGMGTELADNPGNDSGGTQPQENDAKGEQG